MLSRRYAVLGGLGLIGAGALSACTGATPTSVGVGAGRALGPVPSASPSAGQKLVSASLTPKPTTLDLAGTTVNTWAYGDSVPGQLIRATAGDFLRVTVDNRLPADTTVHWHGIRLRNAADGVPGVTQDPIKPGAKYVYEFTAPDPGTYFFHPHVGVQLDRGLYAPLIIDDPAEPGKIRRRVGDRARRLDRRHWHQPRRGSQQAHRRRRRAGLAAWATWDTWAAAWGWAWPRGVTPAT